MSELTDERKRKRLERQMLKFERQVVALDRVYKYILTHPDFDLRKKLPREIREEIGELQEVLLEELRRMRVEYAGIEWKYPEEQS